jgi:glyoxylase-like metal-dependent hydrolase (beta-lactamase superfamily II)
MEQISDGVYIETGYTGVTLGVVVREEHLLLIDSPIKPEDVRAWRTTIQTLSSTSTRLLVNLDGHVDRTVGTRAMDCIVIAQEKTTQQFRNRPTSIKPQEPETGSDAERCGNLGPIRWALPEITFSDRLELAWDESPIILEHHPGSSPGAIWVILPDAKVIFVGDAIIPNQPPFLALADLPVWQESLKLLLEKYKNYTVIGGRTGPVSHEQIRWQVKLLQTIESKLASLADKKASTDAIEQILPSLLNKINCDESTYNYKRLRWGIKQYYQHLHLTQTESGDAE